MDREVELVQLDRVSGGAGELHLHRLAAVPMPELSRSPAVIEPAIAPLHEYNESREEVRTLIGESVALPGFAISLAGGIVGLALLAIRGSALLAPAETASAVATADAS